MKIPNQKDIMNDQEFKQNDGTTPDQIQKNELEACQTELSVWKDRCMRTMADFQNFQQRLEKERVLWMDRAQERVLKDVILLFDDVDRATQELKKQDVQNVQVFMAGLELLHKQAIRMLEKYGVKEFTVYDQFDPEMHEAISYVPVEGKQSGSIVEIFQKGFMYKDQVLRIAKVSVAQ